MFNKTTFALLFVLYGLVFAEGTESTVSIKDTNHHTLSIGYSNFGFNTFVHFDRIKTCEANDNLLCIAGFGLGLVEEGLLALSGDLQLGILLSNISNSAITLGFNPRINYQSAEFITQIGFLYKQWLFNLGYSACFGYCAGNSISLNAGYIFRSINEKKIENVENVEKEKPVESEEKPEKSTARYFRPGIEFNYPVYRSEIEFFDNAFPYLAIGTGLFFRIGPEYFYLATGVYAMSDALYKEGFVYQDFSILGINIIDPVPLLDLEWVRLFVEVPLLLNFGSGQIRFTGGALFNFYTDGEINVNINKDVPIIGGQNFISANDAKRIEERFNAVPETNLYWVVGLDIDVVRHWGIGVKCLIWGGSISESEDYISAGIEPSRFQTRVSTYFVF